MLQKGQAKRDRPKGNEKGNLPKTDRKQKKGYYKVTEKESEWPTPFAYSVLRHVDRGNYFCDVVGALQFQIVAF